MPPDAGRLALSMPALRGLIPARVCEGCVFREDVQLRRLGMTTSRGQHDLRQGSPKAERQRLRTSRSARRSVPSQVRRRGRRVGLVDRIARLEQRADRTHEGRGGMVVSRDVVRRLHEPLRDLRDLRRITNRSTSASGRRARSRRLRPGRPSPSPPAARGDADRVQLDRVRPREPGGEVAEREGERPTAKVSPGTTSIFSFQVFVFFPSCFSRSRCPP